MRLDDAISSSRDSPIGTTLIEMSVTPASANECKRRQDRRLAPGHENVAHGLRVAVVKQLLVVRRHLGLGQYAVGAGHGDLDLLIATGADGNSCDDARWRPVRRLGRTA